MRAAGLIMLPAVAALTIGTGMPVFAAMIGVVSLFAAAGVAIGLVPLALLTALPARVFGLLETDLLQALPLFVLMGGLLNRLPLAGIVFRAFASLLGRSAAAPAMAGFGIGLLLAPMNGSAGASVAALMRVLWPRLRQANIPDGQALGAICAASTLGVVVPPSLVLILFGDAVMRAHTEAVNTSHASVRILNTGDVFRGALIPAGLLFLCYLGISWWRGHRTPGGPRQAVSAADWVVAVAAAGSIALLLAAVVVGYLYAVEAAASGAVALTIAGIASGHLRGEALRDLIAETTAVTGALFALFLAATSFTLVFRAFGSDRLLAELVAAAPFPALFALAAIAICALVLDAFEIVLAIVPLLLPPVLVAVPDALWMAVLVLLVVQASFLIPPFGYAAMMARGLAGGGLSTRDLARGVAPYLAAQLLVLCCVCSFPALVHALAPSNEIVPVMTEDAARGILNSLPGQDE
jgi:tripartite ATP-independent transporter DctM subunit